MSGLGGKRTLAEPAWVTRIALKLHLKRLNALAPKGALGALHIGHSSLQSSARKIETRGPHLVDQLSAIEYDRAVPPIEPSKRGQRPLARRGVQACVEAEVEQLWKDLMFRLVNFAQTFHARIYFRKGRHPFA